MGSVLMARVVFLVGYFDACSRRGYRMARKKSESNK